jgi:hypothetical protein
MDTPLVRLLWNS